MSNPRPPRVLLVLIAVYCVASFVHFAHNAEFIADYPNLPAWLTRAKVYASWLAVTGVGAIGMALFLLGRRIAGLLVIAAYAALGFAGLDHYWVASVSAHTLAMNATIAFEVAAAAALLAAVAVTIIDALRRPGAIRQRR